MREIDLAWIYQFTQNINFPEPSLEIHRLHDMVRRGEKPYSLLSDRSDAPMAGKDSSKDEGDRVFLGTSVMMPTGRELILHGFATIGPLHQGATPDSVVELYGRLENRSFRELIDVSLYHSGSINAKSIGMSSEEIKKFLKGMAYAKRIDPVVWRMSLLRLTDRENKSSDWFHLSIANPTWVLRKINVVGRGEMQEILRGTRGDLCQQITDRYFIDRQVAEFDACHVSGFATTPKVNNEIAWRQMAAEQERLFVGDSPQTSTSEDQETVEPVTEPEVRPVSRIPLWVKIVFTTVFAPIIVGVVVEVILHWFRLKS